MKELVLHFGLTKTGTSTIQRSVFQKHSQIFFLGKSFPPQDPKGCATPQVFDFVNPLLWDTSLDIDVDKHKEKYRSILAQSATTERAVVASWEALGNAPALLFKRRLERVLAVCGNTRLMVTLRNPLDWLPSLYLQALHSQFNKSNQPLFGRRAYLDLQAWMNRHVKKFGGISSWLSYAENIKCAVTILGKENVGVFVFEELRSNPQEFYTSVSKFMNIDAKETLRLASGSHHNKRLLQGELEYSQRLDSSLISRVLWLMQSPDTRQRKRMLASDSSENYTQPAKVKMTDEWVRRVADGTRDGHKWLVNEFGLNLEGHRYPL